MACASLDSAERPVDGNARACPWLAQVPTDITMSLSKREFLQVLAAASVSGMGLQRHAYAENDRKDCDNLDLLEQCTTIVN